MKQLIKFKRGTASTVLNSGPIDLSKLGRVSVERASEILFDEDKQRFYIKFLQKELTILNGVFRNMFFETYQEAIVEEVFTINRARKTGYI